MEEKFIDEAISPSELDDLLSSTPTKPAHQMSVTEFEDKFEFDRNQDRVYQEELKSNLAKKQEEAEKLNQDLMKERLRNEQQQQYILEREKDRLESEISEKDQKINDIESYQVNLDAYDPKDPAVIKEKIQAKMTLRELEKEKMSVQRELENLPANRTHEKPSKQADNSYYDTLDRESQQFLRDNPWIDERNRDFDPTTAKVADDIMNKTKIRWTMDGKKEDIGNDEFYKEVTRGLREYAGVSSGNKVQKANRGRIGVEREGSNMHGDYSENKNNSPQRQFQKRIIDKIISRPLTKRNEKGVAESLTSEQRFGLYKNKHVAYDDYLRSKRYTNS